MIDPFKPNPDPFEDNFTRIMTLDGAGFTLIKNVHVLGNWTFEGRKVEFQGKVHYTHFPMGRGRVTVAWVWRDSTEDILYACSVSSPTDNFNRKTGRTKASGRLSSLKKSDVLKVEGLMEVHPDYRKSLIIETLMDAVKAKYKWRIDEWETAYRAEHPMKFDAHSYKVI